MTRPCCACFPSLIPHTPPAVMRLVHGHSMRPTVQPSFLSNMSVWHAMRLLASVFLASSFLDDINPSLSLHTHMPRGPLRNNYAEETPPFLTDASRRRSAYWPMNRGNTARTRAAGWSVDQPVLTAPSTQSLKAISTTFPSAVSEAASVSSVFFRMTVSRSPRPHLSQIHPRLQSSL